MKKLSFALTIAILSSACGANTQGVDIVDEIHAYNDGVRWQQYPRAAARVLPKKRDSFVAELAARSDEVKISEWDLIHLERPPRKANLVRAHVRYRWFRDSVGTLYDTSTVQVWKRFGKKWLVTGEERVRGEPMPGVDEPEEASQDEEVPKKRASTAPATTSGSGSRGLSGSRSPVLRQMAVEFR